MKPLFYLTIAEISQQLRTGELTSRTLVETYLSRISDLNVDLAAYITITGEHALDMAQYADKQAANGNWLGPLHGVPIALKDVIDSAEIRTTCHSKILLNNIPTKDAECLRRLRAAGAILLGKLATHEFAFGGPSHDLPFPAAKNPWNTDHIPGGSSSGSGAAVAAGLCAGALGSDTSGSIRMPAGNCGVVGLKPTYGRVSRHGLFPLSYSMDHVGPMAWTVEDCALLLQSMAGYDAKDPFSADQKVPDFSRQLQAPIKGLRIGYAKQWEDDMLSDCMASAMQNVLGVLKEKGAEIIDIKPPSLAQLNACGRLILLSEGYAVHREKLVQSPDDFGKFTRDRMRLGAFITAEQYIQAQRLRQNLSKQMMDIMQSCDVLICANQFGPAEKFEDATDTFPFFNKPYITMPFDVTGQPAMSVPCGFAKNGLPLAFQIAGRPFDEATILRVGYAFEKTFGGRDKRPSLLDQI